jgi:hypothetical protein
MPVAEERYVLVEATVLEGLAVNADREFTVESGRRAAELEVPLGRARTREGLADAVCEALDGPAPWLTNEDAAAAVVAALLGEAGRG